MTLHKAIPLGLAVATIVTFLAIQIGYNSAPAMPIAGEFRLLAHDLFSSERRWSWFGPVFDGMVCGWITLLSIGMLLGVRQGRSRVLLLVTVVLFLATWTWIYVWFGGWIRTDDYICSSIPFFFFTALLIGFVVVEQRGRRRERAKLS